MLSLTLAFITISRQAPILLVPLKEFLDKDAHTLLLFFGGVRGGSGALLAKHICLVLTLIAAAINIDPLVK